MPVEPPESVWPADCEQHFLFKAHGMDMPGDESKYSVEAGAQHLTLFYFAAPWTGDVQMLEARSKIDSNIVHHWTLYALDNPDVRDGEIRSGGDNFYAQAHGGAQGLYSAGPGATDLVLPEGVGLRVPTSSNLWIGLEVHYFNTLDTTVEDSSGIEICVTTKKRPEEAASHLLGLVNFTLPAHAQTEIKSTCRPTGQTADVHLMSVIPHMHLRGKSSKYVLNRRSGEQVTLLDLPYTFQEQRSYDLPTDRSAPDVVLSPGDTLTSTCVFQNDSDTLITSGDRTENEMCQPMVIAWPAGILTNGLLPEALFAGSDTGCVEF